MTEIASNDKLRQYLSRVERLEEEKAGIASDIKDVYAEAKSEGFNPKIMKAVFKLSKMQAHERQEQEELIDLYSQAVGLGS